MTMADMSHPPALLPPRHSGNKFTIKQTHEFINQDTGSVQKYNSEEPDWDAKSMMEKQIQALEAKLAEAKEQLARLS